MNTLPSLSDFWQHRCNRLGERYGGNGALKVLSHTLWQSFKEETHQLVLAGPEKTGMHVKVYSVMQGPPCERSFFDWQHFSGAFRHTRRLRAVHAGLRCALACTEAHKAIGAVGANLQELMLSQVEQLCAGIAAWWERTEGIYLSPFAQMGYVMRNWLEGVYGDKPSGQHPSLDALVQTDADHRMLMAETVKSVFSILRDEFTLGDAPHVGLVGVGAWAETAVAELRSLGAICDHFDQLPVERELSILFLLHSENCITPEMARKLDCGILVELVPGQINPDADQVLMDRGVVVFPDLLCASAQEIVEDWWLGGRRVPGWAMALYIKLKEVWQEARRKAGDLGVCLHEAMLIMALERVSERWEI